MLNAPTAMYCRDTWPCLAQGALWLHVVQSFLNVYLQETLPRRIYSVTLSSESLREGLFSYPDLFL